MKSRPKNRIFLELANNKVTPEWVAKNYKAFGVEQPPFEQISQSIIEVQKEIREGLKSLHGGGPVSKTMFPLLCKFEETRLVYEHKNDSPEIWYGIDDTQIAIELSRRGLTPDKKYSFIAAEAARDFLKFLEENGPPYHVKMCDVCSNLFADHKRKRCSVKCSQEHERKYDRRLIRDKRLSNFLDEVKRECPNIKDFLRNERLINRAKRFKCGYGEVFNHVRRIFPT